MRKFLINEVQQHKKIITKLLEEIKIVDEIGNIILKKLKEGGKVIIFVNGGSAADSQHMVAELIGHFKKKRDPIPAISLTTNTSNLTAISNDFSFEEVFERQILGIANSNDVVIGISTSGNSPNVLKAIEAAKKIGATTIGLTGEKGVKLRNLCDICIMVPSSDTQRIQECHILLIHLICGIVENGK